jgi:hypothetical protein
MKKLFFFLAIPLLYTSCKKEEEPVVDATVSAIDLIDNTKGFHRIYRFFEADLSAGATIKAVDMTTEGNNKLNVAFLTDVNNSVLNRSLKRFSVDYTNNAELKPITTVAINWTTYFEHEFFQFAPFTDLLAYGYGHLTYYNVQGDIQEATGAQAHIGASGRIAKYPHLVVNPFYFSDGIDRGDIYSYMTNGTCKTYWDYAGYQGNSPFNEGIFEPISGTNDGVLIAFHADSVNAYLRDLTDTVKYHGVRNSSVALSQNSLSLISNTGKVTLVKNNTTNNNFSFAIVGVTPSNTEIIYLTFKYDYTAKTITKVIDKGAAFKSDVLAYDIDSDGNFYFIKTDKSIYKTTASGTTKIFSNVILAGTPNLLKVYNGKIFLGITNTNNSRQLDVVVQD